MPSKQAIALDIHIILHVNWKEDNKIYNENPIKVNILFVRLVTRDENCAV